MDDKQLVEIILKQVVEKLKSSQSEPEEAKKPKVLILSEEHKNCCHEVLEQMELTQLYQFECALTLEYNCRLEDYEAVVLFSLTNMNLGKLTTGIGDTPYLNLALQAILKAKSIYIPNEAVDLFSYQAFAPKAFYSMMLEKIEFLKACGVNFCELNQLEGILRDNISIREGDMGHGSVPYKFKQQAESSNNQQEYVLQELKGTKEDVIIDKKVITERDMKRAWEEGAAAVCVSDKAIISDLAKEFAKNRNILLKRRGL